MQENTDAETQKNSKPNIVNTKKHKTNEECFQWSYEKKEKIGNSSSNN